MRAAPFRTSWNGIKPPPGTPINPAHPLAQGLLMAWLGGDYGSPPVESFTGMIGAPVAGLPSDADTPLGRASLYNGTAGSPYHQLPGIGAWQAPLPVSYAVLCTINDFTNFTVPFATHSDPATGTGGFALSVRTNGSINSFMGAGGSGWSYVIGQTGLTTGVPYLLAYSWIGASTCNLYRNGQLDPTSSSSFGGGPNYPSLNGGAFGAWKEGAGGVNYNYSGSVLLGLFWNRALTDSEHLQLATAPFEMFGMPRGQPPSPAATLPAVGTYRKRVAW
jgi:hypothetical protein